MGARRRTLLTLLPWTILDSSDRGQTDACFRRGKQLRSGRRRRRLQVVRGERELFSVVAAARRARASLTAGPHATRRDQRFGVVLCGLTPVIDVELGWYRWCDLRPHQTTTDCDRSSWSEWKSSEPPAAAA